ncbi:uncharacterized protein LOC132902664 [Amyelois transitella]|uniref:uncharacterized protein LOC132902664 n=1 Tax=Amyelois transitella TaxID=680683 RepID=UPI0029901193|nr:uncharacterized protein LOC132902664 [Amyelois transitella]
MEKRFHDAREERVSTERESDEKNDGQDSSRTGGIYKVSVRVPPFWPEEPEIWFAQVEGQFAISGITSDATKFNYVISQLDNKYSREVKDIIISPPAVGRYEKLKAELIKRLTASNENKLKQLLMHEELGDRKPSQFLRHLKGLAGLDVPDDFLKTIWISRLPHSIQTILASQPATAHPDDLADLADRVNDLTSTMPKVASMSQQNQISEVEELKKEVAHLRRRLQDLTTRSGRSRERSSRRPTHSKSRSRQRSHSNYQKFPLCWYHAKFGEKAYRCILPCDYSAGNAKGSR